MSQPQNCCVYHIETFAPSAALTLSCSIPIILSLSTIVSPVSLEFPPVSFHINQTNNSWDTATSQFELETSKVKAMSDVKGHILYTASNQCTSSLFRINRTDRSWDMTKIMFDVEKHIRNFKGKFVKIITFNKTFPTSKQVITMTMAIKLQCYVVVGWVVLA